MEEDKESVGDDVDSPIEADESDSNNEPTEPKPTKARVDDEDLDDTIFIRNVARFETTQESLKAHMEKNWGETVYCLICKDRETGESKGTAFVKFKEPESAGECLGDFEDREMQQKFFLDGRNLFVLPALNRNQMGEVKAASAKKIDVLEKKVKKPRWYRTPKRDDADSTPAPPNSKSAPSNRKQDNKMNRMKNKKDLKSDRRSKRNQMAAGGARGKKGAAAGQGPNGKRKPPPKVGGRPHANKKGKKNADKKKFNKTKKVKPQRRG